MILHDFPDLEWLRQQSEQNFANRQGWAGRTLATQGWPNVILNVKTQNICRDNIRGPLSIFCNLSGESVVEAGHNRIRIRESCFYITNQDQHYTLEVQRRQAETFNIHFGFFTEQVFSSLSRDPGSLLEDGPLFTLTEQIGFHNRLHIKGEAFNKLVLEIKKNNQGDDLLFEEKLYNLMTLLLAEEKNIRKVIEGLPAVKDSTRTEIIRRLLLATDFIQTNYDIELSLDKLAGICCLSKFHFLRLFKIAFRTTPHHYINQVRTERAKELLRHSKLDIHSIARHVGFRDASSFSRMFQKQVGVYPTQFH